MLQDKVYLWLSIVTCVALIAASVFAWAELAELKDPQVISANSSPFK
jgi:hypothetical protein